MGTELAVNAIVVWLIQKLKLNKAGATKWMNENTPWVTRLIAAAAAGLTAIGIDWQFAADSGTLTVTGIDIATIGVLGWETAKNYVAQHLMYHIGFKKK